MESMVYSFRSWLREDENEDYVEEGKRNEWIEKLNEMEDWLYEDGADANYTVYQNKHKDLQKEFGSIDKRKTFDQEKDKTVDSSKKVMVKIVDKVAEMKEKKPWISEEEKKDVLDRLEEVRKWMEEELAK